MIEGSFGARVMQRALFGALLVGAVLGGVVVGVVLWLM